MPYELRKAGTKTCVVKKADGKQVACHSTPEKAKAQMRALYAKEGITGKAYLDIETAESEKLMSAAEDIRARAQEFLSAEEAITWTQNAEGLPQADVVIIRAGESANRRHYSKEAIQDAVNRKFWDNTPMFVDHGQNRAMPRARSYRDLVAKVEPNSTYVGQEGEARGRVTFVDKDFAEKAKNTIGVGGLSAVHEFLGQRFRGTDGHRHERVDKFVVNHSLDFVVFPAAGGGIAEFYPASESEEDVDWDKLDKGMLVEHRPDLVDDIKTEAIAANASEADDGGDDGDEGDKPDEGDKMIALEAVQPYIKEQIDQAMADQRGKEAKQKQAREQTDALVAKSGLPALAQAAVRGQFDGRESFEQEAVQGAIDAKVAELKEGGWRGPTVRGLGDSTPSGSDDAPAEPIKPWAAFESQMEYVPPTGTKQAGNEGKVN